MNQITLEETRTLFGCRIANRDHGMTSLAILRQCFFAGSPFESYDHGVLGHVTNTAITQKGLCRVLDHVDVYVREFFNFMLSPPCWCTEQWRKKSFGHLTLLSCKRKNVSHKSLLFCAPAWTSMVLLSSD